MGAALGLAALATAAFGETSSTPRTAATAAAHATIVSPATLRLGDGATPRVEPADRRLLTPRPRAAQRPCDGAPDAPPCPAIVFDLP